MSVLLYVAVPIYFSTMAVEYWLIHRKRVPAARSVVGYERRDTWASLGMGLGYSLLSAAVNVAVFGWYVFLYQHRLLDIGHGVAAWVLLFFAEDLVYYLWHRGSHEVRCLWAAHVNHHSSEHFNLSTALRQSWTTPLTQPLFYWVLPLLGFHPAMIFTQVALSMLYQFGLHTELVRKLGPLEWVLNTPSHHRVHHGVNVEYLDRNHGGVLIIWDRLFGTFEPERARVHYGLTTNLQTFNLLRVAFHEWRAIAADVRRAESWGDKLGAVFMPPGWSRNKQTLTANEMRARLASAPKEAPAA